MIVIVVVIVKVFVFRIGNVDGHFILLGFGPLEKEAESDVIAVSGEFPEQGRSVFMSWNPDSDRFSVANLKIGIRGTFSRKMVCIIVLI